MICIIGDVSFWEIYVLNYDMPLVVLIEYIWLVR